MIQQCYFALEFAQELFILKDFWPKAYANNFMQYAPININGRYATVMAKRSICDPFRL